MADLRDSIRGDAQATLERLLRKRLYVLLMRPVRELDAELSEQMGELLPAHFEWVFEQERNGRMFAAGPFLGEDEQTYTGEGMFIIRAESLADARALAATDPMISGGIRTVDVRAWELNEGRVSVTVRYSDGTFSLD